MTRRRHVDDALGAYVLGALEDDERQVVEAHLSSCDACRSEHERLAALPALLDLVQSRRMVEAPKPPAHLEDAVVARVVGEREARAIAGGPRRWRERRPLAVAALAGALAGVAATLALGGVLSGPGPERLRLASTDGSGASAQATLHRSVANTRIALEVRDLPPPAPGQVYEVWLVHEAGRVSAGTFSVGDGDRVSLELNAAGAVARYERIGITREPDAADPAANGPNVLAAPIGPS